MRILVAVTSYFPDAARGCHQAIRDGWGKDVKSIGADLRFFLPYPCFMDSGNDDVKLNLSSYVSSPDEVWFKMDGVYTNMSRQVQNIMKWAIERDYDFVHLCANDTFTIPQKLFASDFEQWDWRGQWFPNNDPDFGTVAFGETFDWKWYTKSVPDTYGWISGCGGMTLSKKAIKIFVNVDISFWISKYDFCGFGYDFIMAQTFGPYFKSGELLARDDSSSFWHYVHSKDEPRYAGVCQWQKDMYENKA